MDLVGRTQPGEILLAAACTNVDQCELSPGISRPVNVAGTGHVAEAAAVCGARLTYFSTDYVFDGRAGPYREEDSPHPVSEYGRQKLEAEGIVARLLPERHLIVRTTVVFGWERRPRNFVVRLIESNRAGRRMKVPNDQFGSPTYAPNLAAAVEELNELGATGLFNVTGTTIIDRFSFALLAADVFGLAPRLIEPVTTGQLNQAALRPLRAGLTVQRAEGVLKRTRLLPAREGLEAMRQDERSKDGGLGGA